MAYQFNSFIGSATSNSLGLPFGQDHTPHPRFNLFHIDKQEMHLDTLSVSFYDPQTKLL